MLGTRERGEEDRTGDNDEHQVQIYSFSPCLPTQLHSPPPPQTYKGAWARTFLSDARQPEVYFFAFFGSGLARIFEQIVSKE